MAPPRRTDAEVKKLAEVKAVMALHANSNGTFNSTRIAKELGIPRTTAQDLLARASQYFETPILPGKGRNIEQIRAHRREESIRAREYEAGTKLINVKINTPGPVGFAVFGDPHIDNPG